MGINTIIIDPGIGFGKRLEDNLQILNQLDGFQQFGYPVLVGTSRKSFIGSLTGAAVNERLGGTIASNLLAVQKGCKYLRVHEVKEMQNALTVFYAVNQLTQPGGKSNAV